MEFLFPIFPQDLGQDIHKPPDLLLGIIVHQTDPYDPILLSQAQQIVDQSLTVEMAPPAPEATLPLDRLNDIFGAPILDRETQHRDAKHF